MSEFFKGVRKHIGKMDATHLRVQYERVCDALERSETLFDALKEGLVRLGPDGSVVQSNPAARELLGMPPEDMLPTLGLPLGKSSRREIAVTYPERRALEIQTIPFDDETIVYVRDVTAEKQRTREELRAGASRAVMDLAAGVAHEIGNPLNALSLNLQLLQRAYRDDPSIAECRAQVARLDGIIRSFLQALRPARPNLRPGSVADPLKACLATLRPQFEERRIQITLDMPSALPPVALDAGQIEQVYFNLAKNALEAVKDGGRISIAIDSDDEDVTVVFRDDGAGMTREHLAHIFEPYRTSKKNGTGLGLMITDRIIRDHGGTIAAESSPGEGTTFTIRLPRLERRIRTLK
ncbi:MAG: PAS domain-containing protein [Kiritimatiellae bacterium]|nr:PAS domain-containing protein [Kiritimatiellia bacterium]